MRYSHKRLCACGNISRMKIVDKSYKEVDVYKVKCPKCGEILTTKIKKEAGK